LLKKVHGCLTAPKVAVKLVADAATSLELPNGSRIVSLPASPEAIRGYSKPALIVEDEARLLPRRAAPGTTPYDGGFTELSVRPSQHTRRPHGPLPRSDAQSELGTLQSNRLRLPAHQ
jgi:hypothetical protein